MDLDLPGEIDPAFPTRKFLRILRHPEDAGAAETDIGADLLPHIAPHLEADARQWNLVAVAPLLAAPAPIAAGLLGADMPLLDQRDGAPLLRQMMGRRDADDPAADDDDIHGFGQAIVTRDAVDRR
jgi:hypothetical protein